MHAEIDEPLEPGQRLCALTQRIGFALWQMQELEAQAATYFVLLVQAKRGMGMDAGEALASEAQSKTFGVTVKRLKNARLLDDKQAARFDQLLAERNWLVHSSRFDCRAAVEVGKGFETQYARIESIAHEALILLKEVGELVDQFTTKKGVSKTWVEKTAAEILIKWRTSEDR